jgi:hypothetical protein
VSESEVWKDVVGYKEVYQVSSHGRVKRIAGGSGTHPGKVLTPAKANTGYLVVTLCKNGNRQYALVHRLVAEAFYGPAPSPEHQVNHKDGVRDNNHVRNLEWVTATENNRHAYRELDKQLACSRGEERHNAKITRDDVREIRRLYATGKYTQTEIAERFGVQTGIVWSVVHGKTWRHVGGPICPNQGIVRGEASPNARLTRKDVERIRQLYATGDYSQTSLARMFSVSTVCVFDIVHRKTWKHVP